MKRKPSWITAAVLCGACAWASPIAWAQDALYVDQQGNIGVGTNTPAESLHVLRANNTAHILIEDTGPGPANQEMLTLKRSNSAPFMRYVSPFRTWTFSAGNFFVIGDPSDPAIEFKIDAAGNLTLSGVLTQGSSRGTKHEIQQVDTDAILAKVVSLPIAEWSYREGEQVRHLGPMAEDFFEGFGLGRDGKGLSTSDTSGVALAAIQGLHRQVTDLRQALDDKEAEIERLNARLAALEQVLLWTKPVGSR